MRLIERNPEFVRNTWLELSAERLIVMPAIIAALFFIGWLGYQHALTQALSNWWLAATLLLLCVWGARQAAQSLNDEVVAGTWDAQRLSAISAGQMALGKLFGGAVFAWYGGLMCLGVYLFIAAWFLPALRLIEVTLCVISVGIFSQALALLIALGNAARGKTASRRSLLTTWLLLPFLLPPIFGVGHSLNYADQGRLDWWGLDLPYWAFVTFSNLAFAGWASLGLQRSLRSALQFRDPPWAWLAFLVFLLSYTGGFSTLFDHGFPHQPNLHWQFHGNQLQGSGPLVFDHPSVGYLRQIGWCLLTSSLAYLLIFYERKDPVALRKLIAAWRARRWRDLLSGMPLWAVTALVTLALGVVTLVLSPSFGWCAAVAASLLFMLRDLGVVLALNLRPKAGRADGSAVIYLLMLYLLAPVLLGVLGLGALAHYLQPFYAYAEPGVLVGAAVQAGIAAVLVRRAAGQSRAVMASAS